MNYFSQQQNTPLTQCASHADFLWQGTVASLVSPPAPLWAALSAAPSVPGLLKIRHIGQTTLGSAAIFGLFLGAGSLIHCGKSY
ncbi:hypothetical protein JHK87_049699 [Glycine soja]|nr:hypothetical protein JHK87_049699 [Glycine soja]